LSIQEGYHDTVRVALLIYVLGVAAGLVAADARPLARVGLALAWPIGPLTFGAVISLLLVAALYVFPVFGALVAAGSLAAWLLT
jgi:hypothetical protein